MDSTSVFSRHARILGGIIGLLVIFGCSVLDLDGDGQDGRVLPGKRRRNQESGPLGEKRKDAFDPAVRLRRQVRLEATGGCRPSLVRKQRAVGQAVTGLRAAGACRGTEQPASRHPVGDRDYYCDEERIRIR